ncbi:MAG: hypothetical protein JSV66_01760, partial [Trueperaceae bacterium]
QHGLWQPETYHLAILGLVLPNHGDDLSAECPVNMPYTGNSKSRTLERVEGVWCGRQHIVRIHYHDGGNPGTIR